MFGWSFCSPEVWQTASWKRKSAAFINRSEDLAKTEIKTRRRRNNRKIKKHISETNPAKSFKLIFDCWWCIQIYIFILIPHFVLLSLFVTQSCSRQGKHFSFSYFNSHSYSINRMKEAIWIRFKTKQIKTKKKYLLEINRMSSLNIKSAKYRIWFNLNERGTVFNWITGFFYCKFDGTRLNFFLATKNCVKITELSLTAFGLLKEFQSVELLVLHIDNMRILCKTYCINVQYIIL